jgi:putative nucleotidyltransferase with HDIG domain
MAHESNIGRDDLRPSADVHEFPITRAMPSILFLDDEQPILSSFRSLFRKDRYALHFFSSGVHAMEFLERNTVDVIISDLRMPEMNGIEFLTKARVLCPQAASVMVSGYENKQVVLDALSNGLAQHYILKPWDDAAIKTLVLEALAKQQSMQAQRVQEVISTFRSLPAPPKFHNRLLAVIARENVPQKELVAEIEHHPAFAARLLRVANSVYFAARNPISTVRDAVAFIGINYVASLGLGLEAFDAANATQDPKTEALLEDLWTSSLRRASLARTMAEKWSGFQEPQLAYVAALLQDVGYVLRLTKQPEEYLRMLDLIAQHGVSAYEADLKTFTVPHDAVGAALLEYWNFPKTIIESVAKHHSLIDDSVLCQILQVAQVLDAGDPRVPHDPVLDPLITHWSHSTHIRCKPISFA